MPGTPRQRRRAQAARLGLLVRHARARSRLVGASSTSPGPQAGAPAARDPPRRAGYRRADAGESERFWELSVRPRRTPGLLGDAPCARAGGDAIHLMWADDSVVPATGHVAVSRRTTRLARAARGGRPRAEPREEHGARRCSRRAPGGHRVEVMARPPARRLSGFARRSVVQRGEAERLDTSAPVRWLVDVESSAAAGLSRARSITRGRWRFRAAVCARPLTKRSSRGKTSSAAHKAVAKRTGHTAAACFPLASARSKWCGVSISRSTPARNVSTASDGPDGCGVDDEPATTSFPCRLGCSIREARVVRCGARARNVIVRQHVAHCVVARPRPRSGYAVLVERAPARRGRCRAGRRGDDALLACGRMSALSASGVRSPSCSANAPTNAAPEAASPALNSAPACCEPTWLRISGRSGSRTTPRPSPTSATSRPMCTLYGIAVSRPARIAS